MGSGGVSSLHRCNVRRAHPNMTLASGDTCIILHVNVSKSVKAVESSDPNTIWMQCIAVHSAYSYFGVLVRASSTMHQLRNPGHRLCGTNSCLLCVQVKVYSFECPGHPSRLVWVGCVGVRELVPLWLPVLQESAIHKPLAWCTSELKFRLAC